MSRTVLILRPQPAAGATERRARAMGFATVATPLFVVQSCAWHAPDPAGFDALIVTSANAIRHAGEALRRYLALPLYTVGEASAAAARAAGFATVHAGDSDAARLAAVAAEGGVRRALHLAGRDHRPLIRDELTIETRIVYAAEPIGRLPDEATAALRDAAVALLHSPRAAALFRGLAGAAGLAIATIAIAAISPAALAAAGAGWRAGGAAAAPTDDALLAAAARLCDQSGGKDG